MYYCRECAFILPCLKSLPEANVENLRFTALTMKVSEMPIIDFLLRLSLMQNILNKLRKPNKEKYKLYSLSNIRETRK